MGPYWEIRKRNEYFNRIFNISFCRRRLSCRLIFSLNNRPNYDQISHKNATWSVDSKLWYFYREQIYSVSTTQRISSTNMTGSFARPFEIYFNESAGIFSKFTFMAPEYINYIPVIMYCFLIQKSIFTALLSLKPKYFSILSTGERSKLATF